MPNVCLAVWVTHATDSLKDGLTSVVSVDGDDRYWMCRWVGNYTAGSHNEYTDWSIEYFSLQEDLGSQAYTPSCSHSILTLNFSCQPSWIDIQALDQKTRSWIAIQASWKRSCMVCALYGQGGYKHEHNMPVSIDAIVWSWPLTLFLWTLIYISSLTPWCWVGPCFWLVTTMARNKRDRQGKHTAEAREHWFHKWEASGSRALAALQVAEKTGSVLPGSPSSPGLI